MWTFSIPRALRLVAATWPFTVLRLLVWAAISVAVIVTIAVGAGLGWIIGLLGGADFRAAATFGGGAIGLGLLFFWLRTLREYLLYLVGAGHVAAMTLVAGGHDLPTGRAQIAAALDAVNERFGEIHLLFVLDQAVKAAVRAVLGLVEGLTGMLRMVGLDGFVRLAGAVLQLSTTFVDELILAREIRIGSTDPWTTARQGVVLYAQNAEIVLRNAAWLTALRWIGALLLYLLIAAPAAAVAWILPGSGTAWALVLSLVLTIGLQRALLDPFCIAALMDVWENEIEGQTPDPAWDTLLAEASGAFRDLTARARVRKSFDPRPA